MSAALTMRAMRYATRWAVIWDMPEALQFLINSRDTNDLDVAVLTYPNTKVVRAESVEQPGAVAYMPVQNAVVLESVGFKDGLSAGEKLSAVTAMCAQVASEACSLGIREMYYLSSDGRTDEAAMKGLGFEKVTAYRKRLICE